MKASALNWELAKNKRANEPSIESIPRAAADGTGRKFDAEFPDGTRITGINTDDDLRRAKDLMASRIESIGMLPPDLQPLRPERRPPTAPDRPPRPFKKAILAYLREKTKGAQNREKTLADKKVIYALFAEQFSDPDMATVDKPMAVAFKQN